jgi:inositol hexakisphosphate/diphosphoinositol-pentakisphosphate kinase
MIGFSPRRSLTAHQDWKEVLETLRAKFHTCVTPLPTHSLVKFTQLTIISVKLPKSFVAIDLSQDSNTDRRSTASNGKNKDAGDAEADRGRSGEREDVELPITDEIGNVASPQSVFELEERRDGVQPAGLPPPVLDV